MQRMCFVKRRGTTAKSRNLVERFDELKAQFLEEVATTVYVEEIPPELILNWDQTASISFHPLLGQWNKKEPSVWN